MVEYSWTQPMCDACYKEVFPGFTPSRVYDPTGAGKAKMCVRCGNGTHGGIYVRIDPSTAVFPSLTEDGSSSPFPEAWKTGQSE